MRYAQEKGGQQLHLVFEAEGRLSQPLCGRKVTSYRMNINVPLGHACKNCLRVWRANGGEKVRRAFLGGRDMIIKPSDFENSGEIDCLFKDGHYTIRCVSHVEKCDYCIHNSKDNECITRPVETCFEPIYELYYHVQQFGCRLSKTTVSKRGTLEEVVAYTNEKCGLNDTVEIEK